MNKNIVLGLVVIGIALMLSGSVNAQICECNSCLSCTVQLNNASCSEVKLTADIINYSGTCIDNPQNFNNKVFDCQGHKIDGIGWGYGIYLYGKSGNTIKNCIITDFDFGIYLDSSLNNTIINNTVNNNNEIGIWLSSSINNTIINNTANNNTQHGILLDSSSNNTLTNNIAKDNYHSDMFVFPGSNAGCNNIIENNTGSGDKAIKYFNHSVNLQNEILSELILCNADNSNIRNVTITGSDKLKNNGLLVYFTDNSNFTNINSSNNNIGIDLSSSFNNLLSNSKVNNNNGGIYLSFSSNNLLSNNTVNNNNWDGIRLEESSSNTLYNNTLNNNGGGIHLHLSSDNIIINNTAKNNE